MELRGYEEVSLLSFIKHYFATRNVTSWTHPSGLWLVDPFGNSCTPLNSSPNALRTFQSDSRVTGKETVQIQVNACDRWICSLKDTRRCILIGPVLPVMRDELLRRGSRACRKQQQKKLSLCGDTAQTRVLFLKHVVRHSSWWACSASGQINGWAQMFLLVKNKDAVGRLEKKDSRQNHKF